MPETDEYTDEEIDAIIEEIASRVAADKETVREKMETMLEYGMPAGAVAKGVQRQFEPAYSREDYEAVKEWDGTGAPPRIDPVRWLEIDETMTTANIRQLANRLAQPDENVVYCIECSFPHEIVRDAEREAIDLFRELPSWVSTAYTADRAFYVGESAHFPERLTTHATGSLREETPPARLTRLTRLEAVGLVATVGYRKKAELLEEFYAENLRLITDEDIYVNEP